MYRIITVGLLAALGLTGCSTQSTTSTPVALGALPAATRSPSSDTYFFGAGDALGQEVFTTYVASIREAEEFYAIGESSYPVTDY